MAQIVHRNGKRLFVVPPLGGIHTRFRLKAGLRTVGCLMVSLALFASLAALPARADVQVKTPPTAATIEALIQQLGHDQYVLREQASVQLRKIGAPALDALTDALADDDIEVIMRARYLLSAIDIPWAAESASPGVRKLLDEYAQQSESDRRLVVQRLHALAEPASVDALCQVVRYDKSQALSKWSALLILDLARKAPRSEGSWGARVKTALAGSTRPGATWVTTYLDFRHDPKALAVRWKPFIEQEREFWESSSPQTRYDVVQALLMQYVDFLKADDRERETARYVQQIVDLQPADDQGLNRFVKTLIERKSHGILVALAEKYPRSFDANPMLLYSLAYAQRVAGDEQAVVATVAKARAMNGSLPRNHLVVAFELQERGWFDWSESEFRIVLAAWDQAKDPAVRAAFLLSEMLHDQQQEKKAADVLREVVQKMAKDPMIGPLLKGMGRDPGSVRSRMDFFYAAHFELEGDVKKQTEHLLKAAKSDPSDADVLIGLYRLPNQTEARRRQTRKLIDRAVDAFREKITQRAVVPNWPGQSGPSNVATNCNQFAWLVGNTIGEIDAGLGDEAIRYSLRSVELRPDAAGYLDTLGRCYYARGDYANAVKHQSDAARREPHSGLIQRQLEIFQKALEASKAKS